jgi:hypothetical protein
MATMGDRGSLLVMANNRHMGFSSKIKVATQGSGFRVQGSTRTGAIILDLLRHVKIGPTAM